MAATSRACSDARSRRWGPPGRGQGQGHIDPWISGYRRCEYATSMQMRPRLDPQSRSAAIQILNANALISGKAVGRKSLRDTEILLIPRRRAQCWVSDRRSRVGAVNALARVRGL